MSKKIIIIGASAAGIAVLHTLRNLRPDYELLCISQEKESPYNKCFLADFFAGIKQESHLAITQVSDAQRQQFLFDTRVEKIDPLNKVIITNHGQLFAYDDLFLGMGSYVPLPRILNSNELEGIFTFQTLDDIYKIQGYIAQNSVKNVVIIGAGLSGLECADGLLSFGIKATLIELQENVLSSLVSKEAASFMQERIKAAGITLFLQSTMSSLVSVNNRATAVKLADGQIVPVDMIICATGLRPNSSLAQSAGIATQDGAILVDEHLRTSHEHIYAGGDVILVKDQLTGQLSPSCTWPDAMMQGMFAAHAIAGKPRAYTGVMTICTSAFFGVKCAAYGMKNIPATATVQVRKGNDYYHQFVITNDQLIGFTLIGQTQQLPEIKRALVTRQTVAGF